VGALGIPAAVDGAAAVEGAAAAVDGVAAVAFGTSTQAGMSTLSVSLTTQVSSATSTRQFIAATITVIMSNAQPIRRARDAAESMPAECMIYLTCLPHAQPDLVVKPHSLTSAIKVRALASEILSDAQILPLNDVAWLLIGERSLN